jgi:nicotinamide mononucleotide transporter
MQDLFHTFTSMTYVQQFLSDITNTKWHEWVSTVTQLASVWYARKNNILVYPTGIIGVLLAAWLYFFVSDPPLYADGVLNIYYFIMSAYGWYMWTRKSDDHPTYPISYCSKQDWISGGALFLISWFIIYLVLIRLTNSNTPMLDSLVSSSAVTAMWWMANRKIENWLAWIVSNIVAIPLNFYKGFMLFTVMYVIFLVMSYLGYMAWRKEIKIMG